MPPKTIPKPNFSPVGRYLLDVRQRLDKTTPNYIHDTQNFQLECHIEDIPSGSVSRFESLPWALARGYKKCSFCFG